MSSIIMISSLVMPFMMVSVIVYGVMKRIPVYDTFIKGAKEGIDTVIKIFPFLLGMMLAINITVSSGLLGAFVNLIAPMFKLFSLPTEVIPMAIFRPVSGNATLAILNDIFKNFSPDSLIGFMASIIQGTTDTTIYILALYFGSIGIKKIRYALFVGLLADIIGIMIAISVAKMFF